MGRVKSKSRQECLPHKDLVLPSAGPKFSALCCWHGDLPEPLGLARPTDHAAYKGLSSTGGSQNLECIHICSKCPLPCGMGMSSLVPFATMPSAGRSHSCGFPCAAGLGNGNAVVPCLVPRIPGSESYTPSSNWAADGKPNTCWPQHSAGLRAHFCFLICCRKRCVACSGKSITASGVCGKITESVQLEENT